MAETLLRKAIEEARLLSDLQSERSAWWELANLKKLQNDFQTALECHLNELRLAQLDELQETELLCLYDIGIECVCGSVRPISCTDRESLDSCHTPGDE